MSVRDGVLKLLAERGLEVLDDTDFVEGDGDRKPISKGNVIVRHFAHRVKEPNKGLKVSIKIILRSITDSIEGCKKGDMNYVQERTWQYFRRECCIFKRGEGHPNIQSCLGLINQFEGSSLPLPGLVFKDVALGDLRSLVLKNPAIVLTNATKLALMQNVASALNFLHGEKIVHRDIKASNILVDSRDGRLVALLSDFGSAKDFGNLIRIDDSTTRVSPQWLAPELYRKLERIHEFEHGGPGDMWAFGCTMIEVLAAATFVWSTEDEEDVRDALNNNEKPPRPSSFPPWEEAWKFIHDRCLHTNPTKRITSSQAVNELTTLFETAP